MKDCREQIQAEVQQAPFVSFSQLVLNGRFEFRIHKVRQAVVQGAAKAIAAKTVHFRKKRFALGTISKYFESQLVSITQYIAKRQLIKRLGEQKSRRKKAEVSTEADREPQGKSRSKVSYKPARSSQKQQHPSCQISHSDETQAKSRPSMR